MSRPVARRVLGLTVVLLGLLGAVVSPISRAEATEPSFGDIAALDELTDDHARVFRLYWAFFDREPDPEGALYWIDRWDHCLELGDIAAVFSEGPEFAATYGELSDGSFVDLVYNNVLDRVAEPAGREFWVGEIEAASMSRVDVMLHFAYSDEFVNAHPLPSDGVASRGCVGSVGPTGPREIAFQNYEPFASVGGVTLVQPSVAVEQIGFHQSSHDGARQLTVLAGQTTTPMMTMESRNRGTGSRSAVDVAVSPAFEIRSPVTGTVLRSGGYVLYCKYRDDFVVIEPDGHPGWEVKIFHINGVQVRKGERVEAGVTVIAPNQTLFPFRSQIDSFTGEPSWGHVHIEVVDPSIPDRPSGRSC